MGGVLTSTDGGHTWTLAYEGILAGAQQNHPRPVGSLIVPLSASRILVGGLGGLWELNKGTGGWCQSGAFCHLIAGNYFCGSGGSCIGYQAFRALAGPTASFGHEAYAVVGNVVNQGTSNEATTPGALVVLQGLNLLNGTSADETALTVTQVTVDGSGTPQAEDVAAVSESTANVLYVADGVVGSTAGGVYRCPESGGGRFTCSPFNTGLAMPAGRDWSTVAAMSDGSVSTVFVGCTHDAGSSTGCEPTGSTSAPTIEECAEGTGGTCTWGGSSTSNSSDLADGSGTWWFLTESRNAPYGIDGSLYVTSQLLIDPTGSPGPRVFSAGMAGMWRLSSSVWHPDSTGISDSGTEDVATDPSAPDAGAAGEADEDWSGIFGSSGTNLLPPTQSSNALPSGVTGGAHSGLSTVVQPNTSSTGNPTWWVGFGAPPALPNNNGYLAGCQMGSMAGPLMACGSDTGWNVYNSPNQGSTPPFGNTGRVLGIAAGLDTDTRQSSQSAHHSVRRKCPFRYQHQRGLHQLRRHLVSNPRGTTNLKYCTEK